MPKLTNAEFIKNLLDINESLVAENKERILSENLQKKLEDVLKKSKDISADQEMTNLLFNQLFKDVKEI